MGVPDTAAAARGGRAAAAKARRDRRGRFVRTGRSAPQRADARLEPRSIDYFAPQPPPAAAVRLRPMPRISGSRARLRAAEKHLLGLAASHNIKITQTEGIGTGKYDQATRTVHLDPEVAADPAARTWMLAHELAHALDPRLEAFGELEHATGRRTDDCELVAEGAAKRAVMSYGLIVDDADACLEKTDPRWERRLEGPLFDRWQCASLPLLRPAPQGSQLERRRLRTLRRSKRHCGSDVRQRQKRRGEVRDGGFGSTVGRLVWRMLFRRGYR